MGERPKHVVVSEWIRERILDGTFPFNSKLLSEHTLAHQFGMSRQTIRQAIGTLVNEGFLLRKRGSGTYIAHERHLQRNFTRTIAVITTYVDHYIFPDVIKGIDQVLRTNGYRMNLGITYNQPDQEQLLLSSMIENGVDGLLVEPTKSAYEMENLALYQELIQKNIPVVFINSYYPSQDFCYVSMDDYASAKVATAYLIEHGHQKLFGIFKSDDIQGHFRYSGFLNTIKDAGLPMLEDQVLWYTTEDVATLLSEESDHDMIVRLQDCTGIVCYNDEIAVKLLAMLHRQNKIVPDDISIVSFDNSDLSNVGTAGLTSIDYPAEKIGRTAAEKLIRILSGAVDEGNFTFVPELIQRGSVRSVVPNGQN